jgi:hypothetical protein
VAERGVDRIPVAAPRPSRRPAPSRHGRVDASGAGLVLLVLIVLSAAAGGWVGARLGATAPGAIMGGVLGLPVAFAGVYLRYKRV